MMMGLSILFPDWNSLDSVRHTHSDLEGAALIFFAMLVVFDFWAHLAEKENETRSRFLARIGLWCFAVAVLAELAAYPYGQRNDTLSEQVIGSLDVLVKNARVASSNALTNSVSANSASSEALITASDARKEADSFEEDISSAKAQATEAESHLAGALQQAASAKSEIVKSQIELARLTGPPYLVPIIRGIATPDLSEGFTQEVLLTSDARIAPPRLPPMPEKGSIRWTLLIDQDSKGDHNPLITFAPSLPNKLSWPPNTRATFEYITDYKGLTTERSLPVLNSPISAIPR